jgi:hypothetical protein
MKPLGDLHNSLSSMDEQMRKSEELLGAFGVELEELVDDVRIAKNSQLPCPKSTEESADDYLETKLTDTLKNFKGLFGSSGKSFQHWSRNVDMRAPDAPPLVLLQRSDILDELRDVVARVQDLQEREERWRRDLPLALSSL